MLYEKRSLWAMIGADDTVVNIEVKNTVSSRDNANNEWNLYCLSWKHINFILIKEKYKFTTTVNFLRPRQLQSKFKQLNLCLMILFWCYFVFHLTTYEV